MSLYIRDGLCVYFVYCTERVQLYSFKTKAKTIINCDFSQVASGKEWVLSNLLYC